MKKTICPRCGSAKVKWIIPQVWSKWVCYDCSYTGPVIEADDSLQREIREDWLANKDKILEEEDKRAKDIESGLDEEFYEDCEECLGDEEFYEDCEECLGDEEFYEDCEECLGDEELDRKLRELDL